MKSPASSRTVILVAIDETSASDNAVRTAALLAAVGDAELHLLHVVAPVTGAVGEGPFPSIAGPPIVQAMAAGRTLLADLKTRIATSFQGRIATHTAVGAPAQEILEAARDLAADVIVVGSHGQSAVRRWILGSVSEQVVRRASCSVVVARPKDYADETPEIEPPCPACVAVQKATSGDSLWCEMHARRHVHGELHYEVPPSFGIGSTFLRPEG